MTLSVKTVIMLGVAFFIVMLNVAMLSVFMLNVIMLSVVMLNAILLSVVMLNVIILSVVMLSVIMLNVMAPTEQLIFVPKNNDDSAFLIFVKSKTGQPTKFRKKH
jgi:hypothetical protein